MSSQKKISPSSSINTLLNENNPAPWEQPVDSEALILELTETIKKFVILSDESALAASCWVILAASYHLFPRCPLLIIDAPERESGKSQLLRLVGKLTPRSLETANIRIAGVFRLIADYSPTLLIDEADVLFGYGHSQGEMLGILNDGFESGGHVIRIESDKTGAMECRAFPVYGPKALAGIALGRHLTDATLSRGIRISMKRKEKHEKVERLRNIDPVLLSSLRSRIHRFVLDNKATLAQGWDDLPQELGDRAQDCWEPLLAIAHCCGPAWYEKARKAAVAICVEAAPPRSSSNQLLEDVREVLQIYADRYIPTATLLDALNTNADMDWCHYNRGQPITARQLSTFLSAYGIKPKTVRMKAGSTPKGYEVREFDEAFTRYLPERVEEPGVADAAPSEPTDAKPTPIRPQPVPKF